ncbi:hypothetical protein OHC33_009757 [Knufia fluminis]|uniref:Uncharacterized protein n=1 Tax=Knufia fluminis TaxID=191047 RepID=A0AAN8EL44_9EURO|nr:hypothetical protein OHC33_009757 [Knufia fluminis]
MGNNIYLSNFETARAYLQGQPLPSGYPRIKYVLSIIDFKRKNDDETWSGIQPSSSRAFPEDNLLQLNIKDSKKVKFLDYFDQIIKWIHERTAHHDQSRVTIWETSRDRKIQIANPSHRKKDRVNEGGGLADDDTLAKAQGTPLLK